MAENSLTDKLCNAAASGNLPDVLFWLQNGADVNGLNKYKRTALQVVMLGSTSVVEALLAAGARPDVRDPVLGLTVTHDAARGGFAHTVRALLQHGANVDLVDDRGNLPLHLAATAGHLDAVRLLIGRTAEPRMPDNQGRTAGQLARECEHLPGRMATANYIEEYLSSH
ncbi:cyclin-dependent kinase 4 inhibitor C [Scophthalmus maximus]|uniref:cyclin-dependent kinase 4 inhibitor C n=1 Tax=Scophthalmus maximus TaxID=52904 RepID=UPI000F2E6D44|nr:cyclin-dependent kinase 4 inhibitor C [Scophthalmus maximus]XP_035502385.1 cyclin-dependent kinase 4 inhibitor C [Scophthalmus maximus]XP_035502386.1 cyclin-dependent kinase 4 inhibitor C [Scophthalmus maximus]XP_035502387.1 cyclin-dependent kinase 4 inhibitor C [Scophthalmus maximus]XP_035502389.1 cyclin-dependent kinase 4 inhibitor C [Scophthalmus maximus]XP_035502390.1 cyclin-dependent kinase 4 inhibitor C [Scophthalmus maximus]XP_035502391.1 cyclin-dependent kinase 4 inhibitor C [Scoph